MEPQARASERFGLRVNQSTPACVSLDDGYRRPTRG